MTRRPGRKPAPLYLAHVVPGLEELAWEELRERTPAALSIATWSGFDRRAGALLFRSSADLEDLLALRLIEDLFAVVAMTRQLPPGRAGLRVIEGLVEKADIDPALALLRQTGPRRSAARPTYRVVARTAGEQAFRRIDAHRACQVALAQRFHRWRLVEDGAALEFWLQVVGEEAAFALRLSSASMRQRTYRDASLPAALKPTVAHALVRLARPGRGPLLDPMCGTGTVLAEAADAGLAVLGGDVDAAALEAAQANLRAVGARDALVRWDAGRLPIADGAVDAVACNLPWGKRHRIGSLDGLYRRVLAEARRVARAGGRIAVLTAERAVLERIARKQRGLTVERKLAVVVRGADAWAFVFRKTD
ncbi:MAG: methyltransferase domain-containing protein [Dehalococcoidia bacterium]